MPEKTSRLLLFSNDMPLADHVGAILAPFGWNVDRAAAVRPTLDRMARRPYAAVLVDGSTPQAAGVVDAIRALSPPRNGTPVLILGSTHAGGAGGELHRPLDEERFLHLLRHWAGPLENHGLREEPWNARYRLTRLLGLEAADAMLKRLRDTLDQALGAEADALSAHRLAGIAGMCGFTRLGEAWACVDRREDGALVAARAQSRDTVAEIDGLLR